MSLDELIEQLCKLRTDRRLSEVEAEIDGILRGRARCYGCDSTMDMRGQPTVIRGARLGYIELIGRRVVMHFDEP